MESLKHLSEAISPHEREKKMNPKKKKKEEEKEKDGEIAEEPEKKWR